MVNRQSATVAALLLGLLLAPPARAQGALEQVKARGELVIATDATYPPFEFKDQGRLQGFDIDLGNEIGKELGVRVRWLPLEWTAVLGSLEARKADLIMSGMTITDERKAKGYTFSRPYYVSGQALARRKNDTGINSIEDLKRLGKTASVQDETTGQYALEKAGVTSILKFDQLQDALVDVRNHRSDAVVADMPALQYLLHKGYSDLTLVGGTIRDEYLGMAARRGDAGLTAAVNRAIEATVVDGRYAAIYKSWLKEPLSLTILGKLDAARDAGSLRVENAVPAAGSAGSAGLPDGGDGAAPQRESLFRWELISGALPFLFHGALITLRVTVLTLLFGVTGGLLVALARLSSFLPLRLVSTWYVELVRGTPLLMQIYAIYFVIPQFLPAAVGRTLPPEAVGVLALSLNAMAYISEIFRAGIESIDTGQMEAARALGMDYSAAMRWVILPQTFRRVLPPLTNEAVALLKDSSLVSVVAVTELMRVGKEFAANTGSPATIFAVVALIYLALTLPLTYIVRQLEARWRPISANRRPRRKPAMAGA